jgi:hypothetical protein
MSSFSDQGGENKNTDSLSYGNRHGEIRFGHLHQANAQTTQSDVTSGVMLQAHDSNHYLTMDNTGKRKGWTNAVTPGAHNIVCGLNVPEGMADTDFSAFFCVAENGDIVLKSENGRIRLIARDIDLIAEGPAGSGSGYINLNSNQAVNIDTGFFDVKAKQGIKIFTPRNMQMVADTSMNIISSFVQGLTCASSNIIEPHYRMTPQSAQIEGGNITANSANTSFESTTQQNFQGESVPPTPLSSTRSESLYDTDFDQPLGNATASSFETGGAASGGALAEF